MQPTSTAPKAKTKPCPRCTEHGHTADRCPYPGPTPLLTKLMGDLMRGPK